MAEVASHGHAARDEMDHEGYLKLANYPLIKQSDMNEEMRLEAVEICASGKRSKAFNLGNSYRLTVLLLLLFALSG